MFTKEGRCEEREKGAELYLWLLTNMANNRDHRALHVLQVFYKPLLLKPHIVLGGGVAQSWHQIKHFSSITFFFSYGL